MFGQCGQGPPTQAEVMLVDFIQVVFSEANVCLFAVQRDTQIAIQQSVHMPRHPGAGMIYISYNWRDALVQ